MKTNNFLSSVLTVIKRIGHFSRHIGVNLESFLVVTGEDFN